MAAPSNTPAVQDGPPQPQTNQLAKARGAGWTAGFGAALPSFVKYQVLTAPLMAGLIWAFTLIATWLATSQGAVTNATLLSFLASWQGVLFGLLLLLLFVASVVGELFGFVTISARSLNGAGEASYLAILRFSLSRVKRLASWGSVVILLNLAAVPILLGGDSDLSLVRGFKLPNFVTSVIEADPRLALLYTGLCLVLFLFSVSLIYTIQFIVIGDLPAGRAVRHSARLVWTRPKVLLRTLGRTVVLSLPVLLVAGLWLVGIASVLLGVGLANPWIRVGLIAALLLQYLAVGLFTVLLVPFASQQITAAFYEASSQHPDFVRYSNLVPRVAAKSHRSRLDRAYAHRWWIAAGTVVCVFLFALPVGFLFSELQNPNRILVAAHRAGGSVAPENSLSGLRQAVSLGAELTEIDVQRTADGGYVLNHDDTFARAAGVNKRSSELTFAEATALDISPNRDGSDRVPGLRDFLQQAQGKIRVIIELKGATADRRSADDVAAMVSDLGMNQAVIVMSLNYDLIAYLDQTYPDLATGFCYFLSIGDVTHLAGDYIILEEGEATDDRITALNDAGKHPIVWTVNSLESMEKFALKPVYALITDEVGELKDVLTQTEADWATAELIQLFFGSGI